MRLPLLMVWWTVGLAELAAQGAQGGGQEIVVLLRDPSGAAVTGAQGLLVVEPERELVALRGAVSKGSEVVRATSDARGVLRFIGRDGVRLAGAGVVVTDAGLGAVLPRLHGGRADRVVLQPMGAVTTATGSEVVRVWARTTVADGTAVTLPAATGKEVRLPAGNWEVWAHGADGWTWQRFDLASGARGLLRFDGPGQRLRVVDGGVVHPVGWPELDLRRGGDEVLLRGAALAAPLVTWLGRAGAGRVHGPRVVPGPPGIAAIAWPPEGVDGDGTETYRVAEGMAEDAIVYGLVRRSGGGFDVVAAAPVLGGRVVVPKRVDGDTWLLLVAPDWPPAAFSWSSMAVGSELGLERGRQLVVEARGVDGLPVADLVVDYVTTEAAAVATRTDAVGRAAFGPVVPGGVLRVSDARFANQSIGLDEVPGGPVPLVVTAGATCRGTATFAGEGAGSEATIVVTLRDPRGLLRPAERSLVADAGAFAFAGLPEGAAFVLFATALRRGVTWSVRQDVRAGEHGVVLELRNEDPSLGPGGR